MGEMTLRQKAVAAIFGVVALYAAAVGIWFFMQRDAWKKARRAYERECTRQAEENRLIAQRAKWFAAYDEEKAAMPVFENGKTTQTTWLKKIDAIAVSNNVFITRRQGGEEKTAGEVYELPIEVSGWEGGLESLVRFMHELENTDAGMFDMRAINFKPNSKTGFLRGNFTVTCAYMREN